MYQEQVDPYLDAIRAVVIDADTNRVELSEKIVEQAKTIQLQTGTINEQAARIKELEDQLNPPPPAKVMRVGSTLNRAAGEDLNAAFQRRKNDWGIAPEVVRLYNTGIPTSWSVYGKADSIVSIWAPPADILSGKCDPGLHALFATANQKCLWTYKHEPEDDVEDNVFTLKSWRNAFRYCEDIADSYAEASKMLRGPILMGWTNDPKSGRNLGEYIPTGRLDFIGWDIYTVTEQETIDKYQSIYNATQARIPGGRAMICEAGMRDPNNYSDARTAEFVTFATRAAYNIGFSHFTYYDALMTSKDSQGRPYDFRLNTQVEFDAIAAAIRSY